MDSIKYLCICLLASVTSEDTKGEGQMNKTKALILLGLALLLSSNLVLFANAKVLDKGDLSVGYAVVTNYDGQTVPLGANVVVTAMSTVQRVGGDPRVDVVAFTWINPAGQTVFEESVPAATNGTTYPEEDGALICYASSSYSPEAQGEWTVTVAFLDSIGICTQAYYPTLDMRATSFNVVPEVPLLGTAGVSAAMLLGLGIFKAKRKQQ